MADGTPAGTADGCVQRFQFPDKSIRSLIVWNSFLSVHDARHANKHNTMKFLINYLFFMAGD